MKGYLTTRMRRAVVLLGGVMLLGGCGPAVPPADPAVLQHKKAVMVLISPSVDASLAQTVDKTMKAWNQNDAVAYEIRRVAAADEPALLDDINKMPVDRVIVVGADLAKSGLNGAKQSLARNWSLLLEKSAPEADAEPPVNVELRKMDPKADMDKWDRWVTEQQALGLTIEWVTNAAHPVPSQWAPSEEADHIVMLDLFKEEWHKQLTFQIHANRPQWIVLYDPIDPARLQQIKAFGIPVADMTASVNWPVQWETVFAAELAGLKNDTWRAGTALYDGAEIGR